MASCFSTSNRIALGALAVLLGALPCHASNYLLYWEAQGVAGYSSAREKPIYYSMTQEEIMQKPSIGFDYLGRFSGEEGDFASAALQVRLAYNDEGDDRLEPQVYNAYLKAKALWSDFWVGHNRPALGISSYFDSHGLLLRTLAMQGFGFDRDWGLGAYHDFTWGNMAASLTTGTGAPIYWNGNYMAAARLSYGVLVRDNFNMGVSGGFGKTLETMGYTLLNAEPERLALVGADATFLHDFLEHRLDVLYGRLWDATAYGLSYRLGVVLDGESRWKVEAQPTFVRQADAVDRQYSGCLSFQATADVTLRAQYVYDRLEDDHRGIFQIYYYAQ